MYYIARTSYTFLPCYILLCHSYSIFSFPMFFLLVLLLFDTSCVLTNIYSQNQLFNNDRIFGEYIVSSEYVIDNELFAIIATRKSI